LELERKNIEVSWLMTTKADGRLIYLPRNSGDLSARKMPP